MPSNDYKATFHVTECSTIEIKAASVEEALSRAREHWYNQHIYLSFGEVAGTMPLLSIRIEGPDGSLEWPVPEAGSYQHILAALRRSFGS